MASSRPPDGPEHISIQLDALLLAQRAREAGLDAAAHFLEMAALEAKRACGGGEHPPSSKRV